MAESNRRDARGPSAAVDLAGRGVALDEGGRPVSARKWSGYGLLSHQGLSLGVVDYVFGLTPPAGETRAIHVHAPYVNGERLRDQPLTLHLDTGEQLDGFCESVDPSSWLLLRLRPSTSVARHA